MTTKANQKTEQSERNWPFSSVARIIWNSTRDCLFTIIRKRILRGVVSRYLATHYSNLGLLGFPRRRAGGVWASRDRWEPAGVIRCRTPDVEDKIRGWADNPPSYESARRYSGTHSVWPRPTGPVLFNSWFLDPDEIADEAASKGLWQKPFGSAFVVA